jgi:hypothetical protein
MSRRSPALIVVDLKKNKTITTLGVRGTVLWNGHGIGRKEVDLNTPDSMDQVDKWLCRWYAISVQRRIWKRAR